MTTQRADYLPVLGKYAIYLTEPKLDWLWIAAPADALVFAVERGLVRSTGSVDGGEVVLNAQGSGNLIRYRRLARGFVSVAQGDRVEPGQVLGRVAASTTPAMRGLLFGVQDEQGVWLDSHSFLAGVSDPVWLSASDPVERFSDPSAPVRSIPSPEPTTECLPPPRRPSGVDNRDKPDQSREGSSEPSATEPEPSGPEPTAKSAADIRVISSRPRPRKRGK